MNDADLDALFAAARTRHPDTSKAEFGFETRLMARLHSQQDNGSVWAMVSWRLIPLFAACVVALMIWQVELVHETGDAEQAAFTQSPETLESWGNLN